MRILYLDPGTGLYDKHFARLTASLVGFGVAVEVRHLGGLPEDLRDAFLPARRFFYSELLREVHRAEEEGFGAVIIGCSADPGLREAIHMARIPVMAPLKAGLHMALLLGRNVAVISPGHDGTPRRPFSWHRESARLYGLEFCVVAWRRARVPLPCEAEIRRRLCKDPDGLAQEVLAAFRASVTQDLLVQSRAAVEEDGAGAIYCGCTLWGGALAPLAEAVTVPVIDPVIASLALAEAAARSQRWLARAPKPAA
jgi:allantoin racemase